MRSCTLMEPPRLNQTLILALTANSHPCRCERHRMRLMPSPQGLRNIHKCCHRLPPHSTMGSSIFRPAASQLIVNIVDVMDTCVTQHSLSNPGWAVRLCASNVALILNLSPSASLKAQRLHRQMITHPNATTEGSKYDRSRTMIIEYATTTTSKKMARRPQLRYHSAVA